MNLTCTFQIFTFNLKGSSQHPMIRSLEEKCSNLEVIIFETKPRIKRTCVRNFYILKDHIRNYEI